MVKDTKGGGIHAVFYFLHRLSDVFVCILAQCDVLLVDTTRGRKQTLAYMLLPIMIQGNCKDGGNFKSKLNKSD